MFSATRVWPSAAGVDAVGLVQLRVSGYALEEKGMRAGFASATAG